MTTSLRYFLATLGFIGASLFASLPSAAASKYEDAFEQICSQVASNHPRGSLLDCAKSGNTFAAGAQSADQVRDALARSFAAAGLDEVRVLSDAETLAQTLRVTSSKVGVGVSLRDVQLLTGSAKVVGVMDDSTAQAAGIAMGDEIVAIDGAPILLQREGASIQKLQGAPTSKVVLRVLRSGQVLELVVERDIDGMLGLELRSQTSTFQEVQSIRDSSPAKEAGLLDGDVIVSVDGMSAANLGYDWTHKALDRGMPDSVVEIRILRNGEIQSKSIKRRPLQDFMLTIGDLRGQSGGSDDWNKAQINHLDWIGLQSFFSDMSDNYLNKQHDLILDLRGASGNDPETAARFAASFMTDGFVLATVNGAGQKAVYSLKDGILTKHVAGQDDVTLLQKPERYKNRLLILVDSDTRGATAAFAAALQKAGRAEIFGSKSGVAGKFSSTFKSQVDGKTVMVVSAAGEFVSENGKSAQVVVPDRSVGLTGDALNMALAEVRGYGISGYHGDQFYLGLSASLVLLALIMGLVFLMVSSFEKKSSSSQEDKSEDVQAVELEDSKVPPVPNWLKAACGVLLLVLLGLMAFGNRLGPVSPSVARSEIVVVAYVDDSELGAKEAAVIEKLKSQYTGDISFKVLKSSDSSVPEGLKQFPAVEIGAFWFDKDGKVIASHRGMRTNYAHRSFHRDIELYTKSSYGAIKVTRVKPDPQQSGK